MARPLRLEVHESADYLLKSLRQAKSAAQAERLRVLWWYKTGQVTEHKEFSERLGRSPSTITRWLKLYRDEGLAGLLEERTAPGKPPRIDGDLLERLKARLDSPEGFASYGDVQQWLEAQSGETIPYKTVHKTVRYRLGAKLKAPRPQNIKQDPAAVATYKDQIGPALTVFGDCFGDGKPLRYLCQDEMRIGLMSQRGRVITSRGVKPIAMEQYVRENVWVYGVVEPLSGWHLCQEYPHLNGTHFQDFINAVSDALGRDLAVMQMDQAQAHRAKALIWPENLIPIFQPPYSPELNPAERFWQHLKSPLKGTCFETLDQVRKQLWNRIESLSAEAIASLTGYDFILEALFCAAL